MCRRGVSLLDHCIFLCMIKKKHACMINKIIFICEGSLPVNAPVSIESLIRLLRGGNDDQIVQMPGYIAPIVIPLVTYDNHQFLNNVVRSALGTSTEKFTYSVPDGGDRISFDKKVISTYDTHSHIVLISKERDSYLTELARALSETYQTAQIIWFDELCTCYLKKNGVSS